nr:unnamed protein product [Callosobruchus analis]
MHKKDSLFQPPPPATLSKEKVGIWNAWCCKGDKEVSREAATKGAKHVELVIQFLSLRRSITLDDARTLFKNEVLSWVNELLDRKQIFRISHILNNIGIDPATKLQNVFYTTSDSELREYIGNHLKNSKNLDERLSNLWHFLELILQNNVLVSKQKLSKENIECLEKQDDEWKSEIAAKLFLRTHDMVLVNFFNETALWKQLIFYNETNLLRMWIQIRYNNGEFTGTPETLKTVFEKFPITTHMINILNTSESFANTKNTILNDLGYYGIFDDEDKSSLSKLLQRMNAAGNIQNIHEIIKKSTANFDQNSFVCLLVDYCKKNKLLPVLSCCMERFDISEENRELCEDLSLISSLRKLNFSDQTILRDNIYHVAKFLSTDLNTYFKENPLIFLALLIFTQDIQFERLFQELSVTIFEIDLSPALQHLIQHFTILKAVNGYKSILEDSHITYFDLLDKHTSVDAKSLFQEGPMPNFTTPEIVQSYGYQKKINYLFYVREQRPSIAAKLFLVDHYKESNILPEETVRYVQKKIFTLALRSFNSYEIPSSCISFLEMVGINSNYLRVAIKAANVLYESTGNFDYVLKLFLNIEKDSSIILNSLEECVVEKINFEFTSGAAFVDAIKTYDIVVKFAACYNIKLPEMFLTACASNNWWLSFLIFAQLNNYPIEQIKLAVQSFKNANLLEHISHSVTHDIHVEDQSVLMRERDSRKYLLSKIGLRKSIESLNQSETYSGATSYSSFGSNNSSSAGSDLLEIDISNTKATLLQTLIRCHNSTDPPRALLQACQLYKNPLLAVFATSYEPDSVVTNWLTWLAVSSDLCEAFTNYESIAFCSQSVTMLLNNCMKRGFPKTLLESFEIFLPTNGLTPFLQFLNMCIKEESDIPTLTTKLDAFKSSLNKCRRFSVLTENDHEMTYLNNKLWLEQTALLLLSSAIEYNVYSLYEQIEMLKRLEEIKIGTYLKCPDITNLIRILHIILETNLTVKFNIPLYFEKNGRQAVIDCISMLLDRELFEHALRVAEIEGLPKDLIIVRQWHYNYQCLRNNPTFWTDADSQFSEHNITADCVVEFYLEYLDKSMDNAERYQILKLAHCWAKKYELSNEYDLERKKWLVYVLICDKKEIDSREIEDCLPVNVTYKEMLEKLEKVSKHTEPLPADQANVIKALINITLNRGNFWLALKLEKMFSSSNTDLEILKLCYSLAECLVAPYQLNTEQRLLLTKGSQYRRLSNRRNLLSTRMSTPSLPPHSPSNVPPYNQPDTADTPVEDTLSILSTLSEQLTNGLELASTVYMTYRISINIEIPYHLVVANTDSLKMLKDALEDDCNNKLEVVHDFINVYKWSKEQISDFICEEIINSANTYIKSKTEQYLMWDVKMDQDFHLVLQLLQDNCSLLGYKIYTYASTMHKVQVLANLDFKISEIALVIELLIMAHNCFTADCNMEGITIILKKCQKVIAHLLTLRSWKLIVRLLTGVGRYTEMNYVFQILRENDQFEFLLRKGSRKDNALKTALLEYLKKYCPDNRDLYKIVALHFTLFSEVALLWEREAQSVIKNLIAISKLEMQNNKLNPDIEPYILLTNTDGTKICLNKAMENYIHATEFHLQGEKLAKAMHSAKQAELIALQMSLLKGLPTSGTAICLLSLNQSQICSLISGMLSFEQSIILVQSYNYQPDWSSVLFDQCILRKNLQYLEAFMKQVRLTDNIVHDISRKFLAANINSPVEIESMKAILDELCSVHTKYRISSELGFTDVVEDLIQSGQLAYLKDTVWKKGYKS